VTNLKRRADEIFSRGAKRDGHLGHNRNSGKNASVDGPFYGSDIFVRNRDTSENVRETRRSYYNPARRNERGNNRIVGQARSRQYSFTLPNGNAPGAGRIWNSRSRADLYNYVFEYKRCWKRRCQQTPPCLSANFNNIAAAVTPDSHSEQNIVAAPASGGGGEQQVKCCRGTIANQGNAAANGFVGANKFSSRDPVRNRLSNAVLFSPTLFRH